MPTFFVKDFMKDAGGAVDTKLPLAKVEGLVSPVLRAHALDLVDIELGRYGSRWVLRFFVDRSGGVGVEDCRRFSEEVGDLLDVSDLIPGSYDLEVSSPGLTRELRKDREFRWAVGKLLHCWLAEPLDGRREFVGRLREVSAERLVLQGEEGCMWFLPRPAVTRARLELESPAPGQRR